MFLSIFGIGPVFGILLGGCTLFLFFNPFLVPEGFLFRVLLSIIGALFILYGGQLWFRAVITGRMVRNIRLGILMTTGPYSVVRHPVYVGIFWVCTGLILVKGSFIGFILPIIFLPLLSVLLGYTEEKWLCRLYSDAYFKYKDQVPQLIPRPGRLLGFRADSGSEEK